MKIATLTVGQAIALGNGTHLVLIDVATDFATFGIDAPAGTDVRGGPAVASDTTLTQSRSQSTCLTEVDGRDAPQSG